MSQAHQVDRDEPRPLVALNADVVGFSRLIADDSEGTSETLESHRQLVEKTVTGHGGDLLNFVGDNFMALFDEATSAMAAAIAITSRIEEDNWTLPEHRRVRFRMGLDLGEVTRSGSQRLGDPLNIAARIQAKARPGGISVSDRVYRALDEPGLRFRSTGHHQLRNIPELVEVFEFSDLPSDAIPRRKNRLALEQPTIAVLPIHAETVTGATRATSEVVRSELVHRLTATPGLGVIDAAPGGDTPTAAAEYMLETGVYEVGDEVRVYAKVLHMGTMNIVTSHRWSTEPKHLLALADMVAEEVARAIQVELVVGEPGRLFAAIGDPELTQMIYQGWHQLTTDTRNGWQRAVELFEQVAERRPDEVYGGVLAAFAMWFGVTQGMTDDPETVLDRALSLSARAVEEGDPTGLGNMVMGAIHMQRGQTDEALAIIEQARVTRPTCDVTFAVEGSVRRYLGQWERAVELTETAMRLAAVTPSWYPTVQACSLFLGERLDLAAATAEEVIEHYPENLEALLVLTATQAEMGLERRARATAQVVRDRFPGIDVDAWLAAHPFKDAEVVDRWKAGLALAGLATKP